MGLSDIIGAAIEISSVPLIIIGGSILLYVWGKKRQKKYGPPTEIESTVVHYNHLSKDFIVKISSNDMARYRDQLRKDGFECAFIISKLSQFKIGLVKSLFETLDCEVSYIDNLDHQALAKAITQAGESAKKHVIVIETNTMIIPDVPNLDNLLADTIAQGSDDNDLKILIVGDKDTYKAITDNPENPLNKVLTNSFDITMAEKLCHNNSKLGVLTPYAH